MGTERTAAWLKGNLSKPVRLAADYYHAKPDWLPPFISWARTIIGMVRQNKDAVKGVEEMLRPPNSSLEELEGILSKMESEGVNLAKSSVREYLRADYIPMNPLHSKLFHEYMVNTMRQAIAPPAPGDVDIREKVLLLVKAGEAYQTDDILWKHVELKRDMEFMRNLFVTIAQTAKQRGKTKANGIFSRLMHGSGNEGLLAEIAIANPALVAEWPWFWMDYSSPGAPKEVLSILVGLIPTLQTDETYLWRVLRAVEQAVASGIPGAREALVACLKNNPETSKKQAINLMANWDSDPLTKDIPEAKAYIVGIIKEGANDPAFLEDAITKTGSMFERHLEGAGILPSKDALVVAYRKAIARRFERGDGASSLLYVFSGTESSRKAFLEYTTAATREEELPGVMGSFFLRADLVQDKIPREFVDSWKGSSRNLGCQAIHMMVEEVDELRGHHPVAPFFPQEIPSDLGPGKERDLMKMLTPQASYEAMKRAVSETYRTTQQTLVEDILRKDHNGGDLLVKNDKGEYVGIRLWRGIGKEYDIPASLESWCSDTPTAAHFDGYAVWEAVIPLKAILTSYVSPNWGDTYSWKHGDTEYEYIVIRSHVPVEEIRQEKEDYRWTPRKDSQPVGNADRARSTSAYNPP
jgi:hypothetical protein